METKKPVWYSLVRYSPDIIRGEVINVGLILHSVGTEKQTKYYILEESSTKVKSILESKSDINTYKSFKDILDYYLSESKNNLIGQVGNVTIGSYYDENFLNLLYENYRSKKMNISEPVFALTENMDLLFNAIFKRYIGEKYISKNISTMTAKTYVKNILKERELLGTKVKSDITIYPIDKLKSVKFNIDFSFKNGVENYIQTVPNLQSPSRSSEWFAKTELMLNNLKNKNTKVHFIYKSSDFKDNKEVYEIINYFLDTNDKIDKLDIDKKNEIIKLCDYISQEAEDIVKAI